MVERKIYSGKYVENYDSGNKCRNNLAYIVHHDSFIVDFTYPFGDSCM